MFKWYAMLLLVGTIFYPLTSLIFKKFNDNGWIFSKVLGFGLTGVVTWYLSYLKILKYSVLNCYTIIAIFLVLNIIIYIKNKDIKLTKEKIWNILVSENIFLVVFILWAYIRSFSPTVDYTTEKFMNYGFLNKLFHAEYMPAEDMWFSGFSINYYYFGQYIASFLTKISFSNVPEGFNLAVITINTFTFMGPFAIGYQLGKYLIKNDKRWFATKLPYVIAAFSAIAVSLGGTLLYPINRIKYANNDKEYYYWADTRYIGYDPDTNDKTINEIVPYSNMVGDLHAHHIDTMFVFLTFAMLLEILLDEEEKQTRERLISPNIILLGINLGIQKMTNYWDFPIYLVVIAITLIFNNFSKYKFNNKNVSVTLLQLAEIIFLEALVTLPFTIDLHLSATKVFLTHVTSPFYKLLVLWGLQTLCVILLIGYLIYNFIKQKKKGKFFKQLFEYIPKIERTDLFAFIVGCCAVGLMIIPEIVYVKDIYDDEYKRANTMYKLGYQSDIMFDIATSYIIISLMYRTKSYKKALLVVPLLAFISTFGYGPYAIGYVTNNLNPDNVSSLDDTEGYIRDYYPNEYRAMKWASENIPMDDVILEKADGSYTLTGYLSSFNGNPTVLAWHGHEWIWRADENYNPPAEENERWSDICSFFNYNSEDTMKRIVRKYDVSYVYVVEKDISEKGLANLEAIGEIVYKDESIDKMIYIIKVN